MSYIISKITEKFHQKFIYNGRMTQLHHHLSEIIKKFHCKEILDIGAGDGKIDSMLQESTGVNISGVDIFVRDKTYIPVQKYDGKHLDISDHGIDTIMLIDVLHHTDNPNDVFKEAVRVADRYIIIKDHFKHGFVSYIKLRMMDFVGNKPYGVSLPYHYLTPKQWRQLFRKNNLEMVYMKSNLCLYKGIFNFLFDSNLHFIAVLRKRG